MNSLNANATRAATGLIAVAAAAVQISCSDATTTSQPVGKAAAMLIVSGDLQQATVGTELPAAVVVRVVDSAGKAVKGQIVNFRVTAGSGSVFAGAGISNDSGEARERWTLGTIAADSQRLEARAVDPATGAAIVFAIFRATATASTASALKKSSADSSQGVVATAVATRPAVKVVDQYGNPVAGTAVTFAIASGGGSLTGASQASDSLGVATVGSWVMGTAAGANTISASAAALSGSPVLFTATAVGGSATQVVLTTSAAGAYSGVAFEIQPAVELRDAYGNRSSGAAQVTMTASAGATVVGTSNAASSNGVAAFANVGISGPAASYTLTYSVGNVVATQSITLTSFSKIAGGGYLTCALTQAGQAFCWGDNSSGQLGTGNSSEALKATAIAGGLAFSTVAMAESRTCAVELSGGMYCWGGNFQGALGDGTTTARNAPTAAVGGNTFVAVAPGSSHTCAASTSGAGYCWGGNSSGQLGDGTQTGHSSPAPVTGAQLLSTVVAGQTHSCGISTTGAVFCWGGNNYGQVGDATNAMRTQPVAAVGGLTFTALAAGNDHVCGITGAGAAYCWGRNDYGQLGDGTIVNRNTPTQVIGGHVFTSIVAGAFFNCALTATGTVWCWGVNSHSQFGNANTSFQEATPVLVNTALRFTSLGAGYDHTCGLTSAGAAYCWGRNDYGQIGDGTKVERGTAVLVKRN